MELLEAHFTNYGNTPDHICYPTFKKLFENMLKAPNNLNIIETGTAAWGTSSTYLFDAFVRKYGGRFWTVDISPDTVERVKPFMCPATTAVCQDSVDFLGTWVKDNVGKKADVVYLDSYDLEWENPHPSGVHGLREFDAIRPALGDGSLLLIDDTPISEEVVGRPLALYNSLVPGKGMYVVEKLGDAGKLAHWYQVLYKF